MKAVLVLLDGLGDRSYRVLNFRTPLAAARTPNMDRLARCGANGLYHATFPGECLPSETAHYLMFGYDRKDFPGRGLLEAVGEGVPFEDADVLGLAHLAGATADDGGYVLTHGRDDIKGSAEQFRPVFEALTPYAAEGVRFALHQTGRNDAVLVMAGDVSPDISDSDPMLCGRPIGQVKAFSESGEPARAKRTAEAVNRYLAHCRRQLTDGPAGRYLKGALTDVNFLVTQRCGRRIGQVPFYDKWGVFPALIASGNLYGGLACELGMDFIAVEDTEEPGADLGERLRMAIEDLQHDFIHVHTKVPDQVAHKFDPEAKKDAIETLDAGLGQAIDAVGRRDDLLIIITADHSTPSSGPLIHSGETVPVTMVGPTVRRDSVARFDEVSAAAGGMQMLRGAELMHMIVNCTDRAVLSGHRMGAHDHPCEPFGYPCFKG